MSAPRVLLMILALAVAGVASGQQLSQPRDAPRQPLPPPPLVPAAPDGTAPAAEPRPSPSTPLDPEASPRGELIPRDGAGGREDLGFFPRVGLGLLGGGGGGLVGAGLGALVGVLLVAPTAGCSDEACSGAAMSGAIVGAMLGAPAGTYFADQWVGGQGTYVSALSGSMVGAVLGVAGLLFANFDDLGIPPAALAGFAALPIIGATLSYQLSHERSLQPAGPPMRGGHSPVTRVLLETVLGSAGGGLLGLAGFVGGLMASDCPFADPCPPGGEIILYSTVISAYAMGTTLGTYGAGVLMKGSGSFWPTLAGSSLGALVGTAAFFGIQEDARFLQEDAGFLVLLAGPVAGAIIGYEVSSAFMEPELVSTRAPRSTPGVQVMPVVTTTRAGGILGGLAGRF